MENIFRGMRVDNGEPVYGYYVVFTSPQDLAPRYKTEHRIYFHMDSADCTVFHEVHPDTVARYTGKQYEDKSDVYLGDFAQEYKDGPIWEVIWDDILSGFRLRRWLDIDKTVPDYANVFMCEHCKHVGTIHDKEQEEQ